MANGTLKVSNIQTSSGSGTITIGQSGETITIPSGVTQTNIGGENTPAFEAYLSSDQNPSNDTETKIQFNIERFDTDNNYDNSSNYRFTPTTAGKYYVYSIVRGGPSSGLSACEKFFLYIYKNGSLYGPGVNIDYRSNNGTSASLLIASTIDFNGSSDYVEIYANIDVSSGTPTIYANRTIFGAYKLIGV
tara:strand:- start:143 stop:712 length:570 start_codon:yes stop_codon:yes gene_type:complete